MDAYKIVTDAEWKIDHNEISLGEYNDMIEPCRDVEAVVRCGECRHCTLDIVVERRVSGYERMINLCRNPKHSVEWVVDKDWYCADGVRRESE